MSDGIDLFSPCCMGALATNKEYDQLKVMIKENDSHIPVYTCRKCKKMWAIEGVHKQ